MEILKDFMLQLVFTATLIFTFQIFFEESTDRNKHAKIILTVLMGLSILLCMSFPIYLTAHIRLDIRIVPLMLGTLYGGWRVGVVLSALIVLFRLYLGFDLGSYTTILVLVFTLPVIVLFGKTFANAQKKTKIRIALVLTVYYCLVGIIIGAVVRGFSYPVLQVQFIYLLISAVAMLLFIALKETIDQMLRTNRQLQFEAKEAELAFLRSQIKPHFLYNALNSIAELCIDDPAKAEKLTLDLSQFMRSSFDFKQLDSFSSLRDELALVKAYVNIETARFGARLNVEYDVEANPDLRVPPLILQPLVENAIRHGLLSRVQGGTVIVSVKNKADSIVRFAVEDNGSGMNEAQREGILNPNGDKKGIGLRNIGQRIKLLYGTSLRIESGEGIGTKVFFDIPASPIERIGG